MTATRARSAATILVLVLATAGPAAAWDLALPDTVTVTDGVATLADLAAGPVPAAAADIVVEAGGRPGTCVTVSRRTVLRRLVLAGAAGGVRLRGADRCVVVFSGSLVHTGELQEAARRAVQPLVPTPRPGAPDSWLDVEIPSRRLPTDGGAWHVETRRGEPLVPGRNAVRFELVDGTRREPFPGTVVLHAYDEVATAARALGRESPLDPGQFTWTWRDLAGLEPGLAVGRDCLQGASTARTLAVGDPLRVSDLRETPVVRAGDPVEMTVVRGAVTVTVRGTARQPGCLGQTIPVRNELNGRLVNARVAGPGLVEWRR